MTSKTLKLRLVTTSAVLALLVAGAQSKAAVAQEQLLEHPDSRAIRSLFRAQPPSAAFTPEKPVEVSEVIVNILNDNSQRSYTAFGSSSTSSPIIGVNLPPEHIGYNKSRDVSFLQGEQLYAQYTPSILANLTKGGANFNAFRVEVNHSAASETSKLKEILQLFKTANVPGVIVYCGETSLAQVDAHAGGIIKSKFKQQAINDWTNINNVFKEEANIKYELLNEPFGYKSVPGYVNAMMNIIVGAKLTPSRVILDGYGYATDIAVVYNEIQYHTATKPQHPNHLEDLSYALHAYKGWYGSSAREYEQNLKKQLISVPSGHRYVTEFGVNLRALDTRVQHPMRSSDPNVFIPAIIGDLSRHGFIDQAYLWHALPNGDTYSAERHPQASQQITSWFTNAPGLLAPTPAASVNPREHNW